MSLAHLTYSSRATLGAGGGGQGDAKAKLPRALWGIVTGLGFILPAMESLQRIVRKGERSCMQSDDSGCHLWVEVGEVETLAVGVKIIVA